MSDISRLQRRTDRGPTLLVPITGNASLVSGPRPLGHGDWGGGRDGERSESRAPALTCKKTHQPPAHDEPGSPSLSQAS